MNKRELVEALLTGKVVRRGNGSQIIFNPNVEGNPFIYIDADGYSGKLLPSTWDNLKNFHVVKPWQENIGNGKFCRVWDDGGIKVVRLVKSYTKGLYYTDVGHPYKNAELLTPEEIKEFSV